MGMGMGRGHRAWIQGMGHCHGYLGTQSWGTMGLDLGRALACLDREGNKSRMGAFVPLGVRPHSREETEPEKAQMEEWIE